MIVLEEKRILKREKNQYRYAGKKMRNIRCKTVDFEDGRCYTYKRTFRVCRALNILDI